MFKLTAVLQRIYQKDRYTNIYYLYYKVMITIQ